MAEGRHMAGVSRAEQAINRTENTHQNTEESGENGTQIQ
jgi:hypothetical protein